MTIIDNEMLWRQLGAAIELLRDSLRDCPMSSGKRACGKTNRASGWQSVFKEISHEA